MADKGAIADMKPPKEINTVKAEQQAKKNKSKIRSRHICCKPERLGTEQQHMTKSFPYTTGEDDGNDLIWGDNDQQ